MDLSAYKNLVDFKNICRTCMNNQNMRQKIREEKIKVDNKNISVLELLNLVQEVKVNSTDDRVTLGSFLIFSYTKVFPMKFVQLVWISYVRSTNLNYKSKSRSLS